MLFLDMPTPMGGPIPSTDGRSHLWNATYHWKGNPWAEDLLIAASKAFMDIKILTLLAYHSWVAHHPRGLSLTSFNGANPQCPMMANLLPPSPDPI